MLLILGGVVFTSCGSGESAVIKIKREAEFPSQINYISPVYSFDEDFEVQSRTAANLVKYTNHGLDSIISNYPQRYNLREKIVVEEQKASAKLLDETALLFEKILREDSLNAIRIPRTIDSVSKTRSAEFVMLSYIKPVFRKKKLISGNLHLAILDVSRNEISHFGRASITTGKEGYSANVAAAFDEILRKYIAGDNTE